MSKGLGHVGRTIKAAFTAQPDAAFTVEELCTLVYPGIEIEKKHRVAVLRAARARYEGDHGFMRSEAMGGTLIFFTPDNVESYAMARIKQDFNRYHRNDDEIRIEQNPGGRNHSLIVPGGAWHRHTEMYKAERDGNKKLLAKLQREQDRSMGAFAENFKKLTG